MKKAIYVLFTIAAFTFINASKAKAQDYKLAAGLKFGPFEIGPSIKYFLMPDQAIEGIVGFRKGGAVVTGLYTFHVPLFDVDKLKFYYGAGAHIGGIEAGTYDNKIYYDRRLKLGLDGVIGAEYLIPQSPIVIGVDLDPRIEVATGSVFSIAPALNLRYTF
ncbi:hypothetical protein MUY27_11705 [Mucilaginibacter sp. RS28]|uniref:DUF3996 domain-containing protein n=1 Tax=Mucilaginibacter straminoryzae TaxID=2932774 RepID=A0A9X2BA31_9SPHI|nr:hypothetical protein [Mucilaginibacter straminoryzae]MCJ8210375.1 hypothetical protein [Mucilaginibacter straminoryzae]